MSNENELVVETSAQRFQKFKDLFEANREKLEQSAPPSLRGDDKWASNMGLLRAAMRENSGLLGCTELSVLGAFEKAYRFGVVPNGPWGEAWILNYGDQAELIMGYKGWVKLMRKGGEILSIMANVVYKQEVEAGNFELTLQPASILHKVDPLAGGDWKDDDIVGSYARIEMLNGGVAQVWVPRAKLNKLSRGKWASNSKFPTRFAGMCRKTAILQIVHGREIPLSDDLLDAAADASRQDQEYEQVDIAVVEPEVVEAPSLEEGIVEEEFTSSRGNKEDVAREEAMTAKPEVPPAPDAGAKLVDIATKQAKKTIDERAAELDERLKEKLKESIQHEQTKADKKAMTNKKAPPKKRKLPKPAASDQGSFGF